MLHSQPTREELQQHAAFNQPSLFDAGNRARFMNIAVDGYTWEKKRLPSAGGSQFAFDTYQLAETSPIGPGVRQRKFWATTEMPLIYDSINVSIAGLGGVIQGQYFSQPLYDPYTNSYGNTVSLQTITGANQ